ncbi:MAG: Antitoxin Phd YefM, type toxin-antitoxin system [bacterium]|jgi:prevent-host-death family protein
MTDIGVAEAKRRFSELLDRVAGGERIVVERRGRPAVVLVPPYEEAASGARPAPIGFASLAGALAELPELDEILRDITAARTGATDRPGPDLG